MFNYQNDFDEKEKPLDRILENGGYTNIFRTIACIGDSLASGEFEAQTPAGTKLYFDMYDHSWGQHISRMTGATVYNFSKGGMSARQYMNTFADANGLWDTKKAADAYIIALGCNDLRGCKEPLGSIDDIDDTDPNKNGDTFAGWLGKIVQRYKVISPDAKFFFVTMPLESEELDEIHKSQANLMYDFASHFSNSYVIDLQKYMPRYSGDFREKFFLLGHLNPMGYYMTAKVISSYIDYIVRHNMNDFKRIAFNNKPYSDSDMKRRIAEYEKNEQNKTGN